VVLANAEKNAVKYSTRGLLRSLGVWIKGRDRAKKTKKELMTEIGLVQASKYFNANWYLETYPDVAQSGMEPATHYVKFGAVEGRDPGPSFSTKGYMQQHPDVVDQKMNPLIHYIKFEKVN